MTEDGKQDFKTLLRHARRARRLYWPDADRRTKCRMAAKYARAIAILGPKWLLAKHIARKGPWEI